VAAQLAAFQEGLSPLSDLLLLILVVLLLLLFLCSPFLGLGRFFSFLILYTVGRTPWTEDQPVAAKPIPTHGATETQ
jgi:hypothetical protein